MKQLGAHVFPKPWHRGLALGNSPLPLTRFQMLSVFSCPPEGANHSQMFRGHCSCESAFLTFLFCPMLTFKHSDRMLKNTLPSPREESEWTSSLTWAIYHWLYLRLNNIGAVTVLVKMETELSSKEVQTGPFEWINAVSV